MVEEPWLLDSTQRVVGDEMYMLFCRDLWLVGSFLDIRFSILFEMTENKLVIVAKMYVLR